MAGGALAKNATSVLVFRFLGGTFAAAPLTNSGFVSSYYREPEPLAYNHP